jgi:hypothetical protein
MPRILARHSQQQESQSLRYVYGMARADREACDPSARPRQAANKIVEYIVRMGYKCEGDLRRDIAQNLKRLQAIKCYRGLRSLPRPPGPRPAHAHQRPHPQGQAQDRRRRRGSVQVSRPSPNTISR